jgi:hypothetical protein
MALMWQWLENPGKHTRNVETLERWNVNTLWCGRPGCTRRRDACATKASHFADLKSMFAGWKIRNPKFEIPIKPDTR